MTYTSGYQPQNTGASAYSPFNRSGPAGSAYSGYPAAVPTNGYGASQNPQGMGSDVFLPPASSEDIDTLSGSIDSKIARIRQAFSQGASPPAGPQGAQQPAASPVPQADIQWALQLEQKVKTQSYQPTQQETARYEDIAKKLTAAQQAPQQGAQQPAAPPIPEADIQWALQLEQKVKTQSYQPTQQETARYEDIAKKLAAAQQAPQAPQQTGQAPGGPRNWSDWSKPFSVPAAPNMPLPIAGSNGQPVMNVPTSLRGAPQTPPAAVLNQPPGSQAPTQPGAAGRLPANVSQQEVQWALQLEQKVNTQQYQPTPQETAQYQNIAQRIAAGQQAPQQPQQPPAQPQFQAPPQAPAQGMPNLPANVSQQEVQWALQLEQRVNTQNYSPTPQEMTQYQNIAQRMAAGQQAPQQPQMPQPPAQPQYQAPPQQQFQPPPAQPQFQAPPQAPQQTAPQALPNGLSQQEVQWALQLEQRVNTQNYSPTPQEMANYQSIAQRLNSAPQQPAAPQQFQAPPQSTLPQYQAPQPVPMQMSPQGTPVQIVPQNYPAVQPTTPQYLVPPQVQAPQFQQQPQFQGPQGPQMGPQGQQPGMPQQMPGYMPPPGQGGPQKPGFMDKLKTAWSTLWS
ncbi:MAG TPA: hypothetical protein V6D23_22640 [Candidatus Obscuribacterales bacterium]